MEECIFCNLDRTKLENTVIDETTNFYILPAVGSLVDGYILIVSKRHKNSISNLSKEELTEYEQLIEKYRNIFYAIYGKYPIVFEHGTPILESNMTSSSVIHAHTHIVNYEYKNEYEIIKYLNLKKIDDIKNITNKQNYIMYTNSKNEKFVSYKFEPVSQMMRKLIAKDLGIEDKYNWQKDIFIDNIQLTIDKIVKELGDEE